MYNIGEVSVSSSDLKSVLSSIHIFFPQSLPPSPARPSTLLRHCKLSSLAGGGVPHWVPLCRALGPQPTTSSLVKGPFSQAPPHSQSGFMKWKLAHHSLVEKDLIISCSFWKKPSHDIQSLWGSGNPFPFPYPVPLARQISSGHLCSMFLAVLCSPTAQTDCSAETRSAFSSSLSEWGQACRLISLFLKKLFYVLN